MDDVRFANDRLDKLEKLVMALAVMTSDFPLSPEHRLKIKALVGEHALRGIVAETERLIARHIAGEALDGLKEFSDHIAGKSR